MAGDSLEMLIRLQCAIEHDSQADVFVSRCPALALYSQGETRDEALAAIKEAVELYLKAALDFDRFDQILRRAGFRKVMPGSTENLPGQFIAVRERPEKSEQLEIEVPLTLVAKQALECRQ